MICINVSIIKNLYNIVDSKIYIVLAGLQLLSITPIIFALFRFPIAFYPIMQSDPVRISFALDPLRVVYLGCNHFRSFRFRCHCYRN